MEFINKHNIFLDFIDNLVITFQNVPYTILGTINLIFKFHNSGNKN